MLGVFKRHGIGCLDVEIELESSGLDAENFSSQILSLISAADLKRREKQVKDEQATYEFEQLLIKFE